MISIVIPNYNGERMLRENLPKMFRLLRNSKLESEVVVVDDASIDKSLEYLKKKTNELRLIKREKNGGFPISTDQGIRERQG